MARRILGCWTRGRREGRHWCRTQAGIGACATVVGRCAITALCEGLSLSPSHCTHGTPPGTLRGCHIPTGSSPPGDRPLLGAASQPASVEVMWREEIKAWPIWRGELRVAWPGR